MATSYTSAGLIPAGNTDNAVSFATSGLPNSATKLPTTPAEACTMARAINSAIVNKLNTLQNKINSLNTAINAVINMLQIPELPDLSNLLAAASVDLNAYRALQAACPQLNLPDAGGVPNVPDLRGMLQSALSNAVRELDQGPLGMITALENKFQAEIAALLAELGTATSLLNCLCQTGEFYKQAQTDLSKTEQDRRKAIALSTYNYITGQGGNGKPSLLNSSQQQVKANYENARFAVRQLLTVPSS